MINGQSTNRHYTTPYDKNISNTIGANITKVKDQFEISGNVSFSNDRVGIYIIYSSITLLFHGFQWSNDYNFFQVQCIFF